MKKRSSKIRTVPAVQLIYQTHRKLKSPPQNYVMPFGKHKGKTVFEVALDDPDYLMWAGQNLKGFAATKINQFLDSKPGAQK